jgi:hypothetical protein
MLRLKIEGGKIAELESRFKVDHGQIQLIQAFMLPNAPYGTPTGWN